MLFIFFNDILKKVIPMKNVKEMTSVNANLQENFYKEMKEDTFKTLVEKLNVDHKILYKHTSGIKNSSNEVNNCLSCKGLNFCKNELNGYCNLPEKEGEDISFSYKACKYMNENLKNNEYKKNLNLFDMPQKLKEAKMKEIYTDDKARTEVIKYIDNYYKNYPNKEVKGLYLHGNFGAGKTYLIAALFNEFAKKGIKSAIIYFPEFLRTLKASFQKNEEEYTFSDKYEYIKKIPLLLIDDIGAENVTAWGRDEILGTLLQYRMNENLPTFFTSNLTIEELENHLSIANKNEDKVKARRIIERIKCLTTDIELIGKSRR